jgi:hypothetical protein
MYDDVQISDAWRDREDLVQ